MITRRRALASVGALSTVILAGCRDTDDTGDETSKDDAQVPVDDTEDENRDSGSTPNENLLVIGAGTEHRLQRNETESYDGVEIQPTGTLLFESEGAIELRSQ